MLPLPPAASRLEWAGPCSAFQASPPLSGRARTPPPPPCGGRGICCLHPESRLEWAWPQLPQAPRWAWPHGLPAVGSLTSRWAWPHILSVPWWAWPVLPSTPATPPWLGVVSPFSRPRGGRGHAAFAPQLPHPWSGRGREVPSKPPHPRVGVVARSPDLTVGVAYAAFSLKPPHLGWTWPQFARPPAVWASMGVATRCPSPGRRVWVCSVLRSYLLSYLSSYLLSYLSAGRGLPSLSSRNVHFPSRR